jgi:hypothetical protein
MLTELSMLSRPGAAPFGVLSTAQLADERELRHLILTRVQDLRNNLPPVRPRCRDRAAFE